MKTDWDYTDLADAYIKRPDYAESALDEIVIVTNLQKDAKICDIGAGVGASVDCVGSGIGAGVGVFAGVGPSVGDGVDSGGAAACG